MRVFAGINDLAQSVGTHLGYSAWRVVSQQQIDLFAQATGDHQWIHVDPERAASGPFGGTIAHGYLTLSLVPTLASQIYRVDGLQMAVNYGANKVRFPAPVRSGSVVRGGVELLGLSALEAGHQLSARVTIESRDEPKPVCVVETLSLLVL